MYTTDTMYTHILELRKYNALTIFAATKDGDTLWSVVVDRYVLVPGATGQYSHSTQPLPGSLGLSSTPNGTVLSFAVFSGPLYALYASTGLQVHPPTDLSGNNLYAL